MKKCYTSPYADQGEWYIELEVGSDFELLKEQPESCEEILSSALLVARAVCNDCVRQALPEDEEFDCGMELQLNGKKILYACPKEICLGKHACAKVPSDVATSEAIFDLFILSKKSRNN